eukprot:1393249-Amorphochlora_amoeboformis.AAC.4
MEQFCITNKLVGRSHGISPLGRLQPGFKCIDGKQRHIHHRPCDTPSYQSFSKPNLGAMLELSIWVSQERDRFTFIRCFASPPEPIL